MRDCKFKPQSRIRNQDSDSLRENDSEWRRNMRLRIYVMTHKKFELPKDDLYRPLHVGRAGSGDLGYPGDDTGENISALNCYYSELTGLYWVWKNCQDQDAVGTCHYRRYLINEREQIFTKAEYEKLLGEYDLITTKRVKLNHSYFDGFSANHNQKALVAAGEAIRELYPEYYETFVRLVNGTETYFGNMLVARKDLYNAYCQWLFSIFALVSERIELETGEDAYHKRVFGFISEFLLLVWVTKQGLRVKECKVGMLGEKAETRELKERLAEYFLRRDIDGAKNYFLKRKEERPDVLMEASDVTGELRLSMQVIATAGLERAAYGSSILERENRFSELMRIFEGINRAVYQTRIGCLREEDIEFLKKHQISKTALGVAVQLPGDKKEETKRVLEEIFKHMEEEETHFSII